MLENVINYNENKKSMSTGKTIFALLVILLSLGFSWTNYTNQYVAEQVLLQSYPQCMDEIREGALRPIINEPYDEVLGEPENMHCDTLTCPAFDPNYCQTGPKSCKSESRAGNVKSEAKELCDCEQAAKLSEAITYFISKYDPMNLMINEQCGDEFDQAVEDAIRSGDEMWSVNFQCSAPNRVFEYDSKKFDEMIYSASSFAFAEAFSGSNPWFCYNIGPSPHTENESSQENELKKNGEFCSASSDCESGFCNNNVCCSSDVCCPVPGVKGYPCEEGEVCSDEYTCSPINLMNGIECDYDAECLSNNCKPGTKSSVNKYCCQKGNEYCCASNSDCLANEECMDNVCVTVESEEGNETINNTGLTEEQKEEIEKETCVSLSIVMLIAGGLYVWKRSYDN